MISFYVRQLNMDNYANLIKRGLKVFLFYLAVLSLCRVFFVYWLGDYMGAGVGSNDTAIALVAGTKLSMQTAGIITLVVMIPAAIGNLITLELEWLLGKLMNGIVLTALSILYLASFPYYRQFHSRFNQLLFNAGNDDVYALFISLVQEFYLPIRLAIALVMAYGLWKLLGWLMRCHLDLLGDIYYGLVYLWGGFRYLRMLLLAVLLYIVSLLTVFGGSFGWETAVNWENAGVTRDQFLNEAILDDFQAVYRGYRMNGRLLACNGLNFTTDEIRNLAAILANRPADTDDLDVYISRQAQGNQIAKPSHIFVIISESFANWPLLDRYAQLHIADGVRGIIQGEDADYCRSFLPNGSSTVSAVTGVVTGLADANLYLTTMPESFGSPYPTASAPQLKELGYEANFWYAGPATWERVGDFTVAQGFDHFYGMGDMPADATGSVWGIDDEYLYAQVLNKTPVDKPSFNVILNVSNHSPYNLDLAAKGFDSEQLEKALPESAKGDNDIVKQLGHYWYADKEIADFVKKLKTKYPDCLILIMGDHADRYNIDKTPSLYERYAIPFIITGKGVHKGLLLPDAAGSQIDVLPTIIEMIAPKAYNYMSIGSSLTRNNRAGVNYGFWISHDNIGEADVYPLQPISIDEGKNVPIDEPALQQYIDAVRSISWWRPKYGPILKSELLEGRE